MISCHMIDWFVTASTVCFVFRNVERETLVNKTEEWQVEPRNVYETRLDLFLISSCKSKYARETSREAILFCLNYHMWLLHRCSSCRTHPYGLPTKPDRVWSPDSLWSIRFEDNVFLKQMSLIKILQQTICFLLPILFSFFSSPANEKNVMVFFFFSFFWKLCCKWQRQHQFPFGNELFSLMCALEQEGLKFLSSSMSFAVRWERGDIRFVILWWS